MRGQVAIEYLIIVGIGLAILIPYLVYLQSTSASYKEENCIIQAKNSLEKLGSSIDLICYQGEPARMEIRLIIPDCFYSANYINNKTIVWKLKTSAGFSDISYTTLCNFSGKLFNKPGIYIVTIKSKENHVEIS